MHKAFEIKPFTIHPTIHEFVEQVDTVVVTLEYLDAYNHVFQQGFQEVVNWDCELFENPYNPDETDNLDWLPF